MNLWSYRHAVALEGRVVQEDGWPTPQPLPTGDYLAQRGAEGWELAFAVGAGDGRVELFLKKLASAQLSESRPTASTG